MCDAASNLFFISIKTTSKPDFFLSQVIHLQHRDTIISLFKGETMFRKFHVISRYNI